MNRRQLLLSALGAAAITVTGAAPAMAKLQYNTDTNLWEEAPVVTPRGHGHYTPIPRQMVSYGGKYKAGTIVVETEERRLYFVMSMASVT